MSGQDWRDGEPADPVTDVPISWPRSGPWVSRRRQTEARDARRRRLAAILTCPITLALLWLVLARHHSYSHWFGNSVALSDALLVIAVLLFVAIAAWWVADLRAPLVATVSLVPYAVVGAAFEALLIDPGSGLVLSCAALASLIYICVVALSEIGNRPRDAAATIALLAIEAVALAAITDSIVAGSVSGLLMLAVFAFYIDTDIGQAEEQQAATPAREPLAMATVAASGTGPASRGTEDRREFRGPPDRRPERPGCSCLGSAVVLACAVLAAIGWVVAGMVSYNTVGLPIGVFGFLLLLLAASVGIPSLILWYAVAHPSGKVSVAVTVAIALILGCGIVLNWAPWQGLKTYFTAEIVGIVAVSTYDHDAGVTHVQLEDGRLLDLQNPDRTTIDPGRYQTLRGDEWRPGASEGDLLLAGENPSRWFTTASRPWAPDSVCYRMSWTTGIERKDTLDLESGLRLPIAPDLDAWWRGEGPFETGLCLNDQGQVIDMEARY